MELNNMIYLDNNSTTPIDPKVIESMMPFLTNNYANASSNHSFGHSAKDAIKKSREQIASLIDSEPFEIIFTSGATESINLGIKGISDFHKDKGKHIITVETEHSATLDVCKYLEGKGYDITYLGVDQYGLINLDELEDAIRTDTILVSIMMVNNETGVIQPIKEMSRITHEANAIFMTDATQAFGKTPINVDELGIDIMAFSAHKIYGPKGIGALFVRQRRPNKVRMTPLIHGGGHERNLRSGTSNVPGIVGFGKAAELASQIMEENENSIGQLKNLLETSLLEIPNSSINGHPMQRLYNVCNICFKGADADAIMMGLENIIVSNGSACTSTKIEPSHVLTAMGLSEEDAYCTLRFSLGRTTKKEDILITIDKVKSVVQHLLTMRII